MFPLILFKEKSKESKPNKPMKSWQRNQPVPTKIQQPQPINLSTTSHEPMRDGAQEVVREIDRLQSINLARKRSKKSELQRPNSEPLLGVTSHAFPPNWGSIYWTHPKLVFLEG